MSKSTELPKNKTGGLNLNWAITQALAKHGTKVKIADVRLENCIMSKSTELPKNKTGGLNLNWAITQALAKHGTKVKIADVRTFIVKSYGKLGEKAVENEGSLSTALSAMRKKMIDEGTKVPPMNVKSAPVPTNGPAKTPPEIATLAPLSVVEQFGIYINSTVVPAQRCVLGGVGVAGSLSALKQAIAVVEDAQNQLGDSYDVVVKAFVG